MMKKLLDPILAMVLGAVILMVGLCHAAHAQSSPGFVTGQVPTATQWNGYFASKLDYSAVNACLNATLFGNFSGSTGPASCTAAASVTGIGSAQKWVTARTLTFNGDVGATATLDGSANLIVPMTMATVNVGPGACGDATHVCQVTTDGKGRVLSQTQFALGGGTVTTTGSPSTGQMTKFSGATSITNAVAGTDYAVATSGSAILKGNGAGGFSNAAAGTDYQAPMSAGPGIGIASNIISSLIAAGGVQPGGRLSLTSGAYVMAADVVNTSVVYYGNGRKVVPYYDGTNDQIDTISGNQVSLTMATSGTGVTNSGGVFDVYWVHSGANRICVVTNGSGGGWASDTGGSNTARGTGYSQVHNTRGYWTNVNSITHCYNGATDYGSVSADQGTYLGSLYTTGAGQTSVQFAPAATAGGTNNILGLWNAYNQVAVSAISRDATNSSWTYALATWRVANAGGTGSGLNNRISWIDGLGQSSVRTLLQQLLQSGSASCGAVIGVNVNATSGQPSIVADMSSTSAVSSSTAGYSPPLIGFNFAQAMEATISACSTSVFYGLVNSFQAQQLRLDLSM